AQPLRSHRGFGRRDGAPDAAGPRTAHGPHRPPDREPGYLAARRGAPAGASGSARRALYRRHRRDGPRARLPPPARPDGGTLRPPSAGPTRRAALSDGRPGALRGRGGDRGGAGRPSGGPRGGGGGAGGGVGGGAARRLRGAGGTGARAGGGGAPR